MTAVLVLLFQLQTVSPAKMPMAVMEDKPVPHWHCPSGLVVDTDDSIVTSMSVSIPRCMRVPKTAVHGFDPDAQEMIFWRQSFKISAEGSYRLTYPDGFEQVGCMDAKGAKNGSLYFSDESTKGVTIKGVPNKMITFDCRGVTNRAAG